MNFPSPMTPGSTPQYDRDYRDYSATPSPRRDWTFDTPTTPIRPATRAAHGRAASYSQRSPFPPHPQARPQPPVYSPHPWESPRYTSDGVYAARVDVDQTQIPPCYYPNGYDYPAYGGAPTPGPERFATPRESPQTPRFQNRPPTSFSHTRHSSMATPKRSSTARPPSSHKTKPKADEPAGPRKANEADAKAHRIPAGYALKNWDPEERPILLLGSVFDFNSLGKWIFDWTVYREGRGSPIADIAGELWLLLIQLNSKIKVSESVIGGVRNPESREMLEDFLESGERLLEKLRSLLKSCEAPMLKAAKKRQSGLGKSSGVEFVHTLFGPDREGEKTETFMQSIRVFIHRFDINCDDIVRNPTR
ncbi:hypothetical protein LMH87_011113 [Akanthomyces muscarius]|uniref:Vegetative cell wall protein gp1 n=1 Tax=Akanthomyces muscarius TaxID=2231603 RepID=A0A9W8QA03_AKAMU|nr:hypothetical protein LMH87_011113 [Akanthomyces muscarius]KAJ4150361.1 hypothetical protein LMH87_011113 [Akanthomyces muscarius]